MHKKLRARLLASALALSAVSFIAVSQPANAQVSVDVSFNTFHDRLSPYGTWIHHPHYGDVWRPNGVEADFHPYSRGHWVNTEDGFTWVSDYAWGDVPFHYGRWVFDDGAWLWVPGYVWAPAWVTWRSDNEHTGWAPLPPDDRFLQGDETEFDVDPVAFYGPRFDAGNFFIFVGTNHLTEPHFRNYIVRRPLVVNIFNRTRNITRISIVNDRVVNRSVDVRLVERVSRRRIPTLSIRAVLRPGAIITNVHVGREIEIRERAQHPRINPPGNDHGDNGHGGNDNGRNDNNDHNGNNGGGNNDHNNGANGHDQNGKDKSGKDTSGKDLNGKDNTDHNNGMSGNPPGNDHGGTHNDQPDNNGAGNGGANGTGTQDQHKHRKDNTPDQTPPATGGNATPTDNGATNMGTSDQTPPKHHKKDDGAAPASPASTPADNGASTMGTSDQTQHKHRKDTPDQTMQTAPGGNTTSTDNGANNMGTSDQTPKHHKANNAMPADQGAPPSTGNGATTGPRTLGTPAQSGDQATPKPKKKDKTKTDGQQDNSPQ